MLSIGNHFHTQHRHSFKFVQLRTPSTETQHPTCLAGSLGNLLEQLRIHISLDLSLNCLRLAYLLGWLVTLLLAPLLDAVECHSQQTYHVLLLTLRPSIVSQSTDLPTCGTVPQAYCLCECRCQQISSFSSTTDWARSDNVYHSCFAALDLLLG